MSRNSAQITHFHILNHLRCNGTFLFLFYRKKLILLKRMWQYIWLCFRLCFRLPFQISTMTKDADESHQQKPAFAQEGVWFRCAIKTTRHSSPLTLLASNICQNSDCLFPAALYVWKLREFNDCFFSPSLYHWFNTLLSSK